MFRAYLPSFAEAIPLLNAPETKLVFPKSSSENNKVKNNIPFISASMCQMSTFLPLASLRNNYINCFFFVQIKCQLTLWQALYVVTCILLRCIVINRATCITLYRTVLRNNVIVLAIFVSSPLAGWRAQASVFAFIAVNCNGLDREKRGFKLITNLHQESVRPIFFFFRDADQSGRRRRFKERKKKMRNNQAKVEPHVGKDDYLYLRVH